MKTKDIVNQYDCKGCILKYFSQISDKYLKEKNCFYLKQQMSTTNIISILSVVDRIYLYFSTIFFIKAKLPFARSSALYFEGRHKDVGPTNSLISEEKFSKTKAPL